MPMRIKHIDAIARQKQRAVLFVVFKPDNECFWPDWENLPVRRQIIAWLESKGIGWQPCAHFANVDYMGGYEGTIYIDIPFDTTLPEYKELEAFLEYPDGSMRFPEAVFAYLPLEEAMKNVEHDEPGFWERWAENF